VVDSSEAKSVQSDFVWVDSNSSLPTMTHVIPEGNQVGGMTSVGADVLLQFLGLVIARLL